ncbi:MAG: hypothetical protein GDA50_07645 [Alphaproteobacteria bacterium GM202ARS2]|nr:hypothetical protein [Alphaproteobacteria bacterium GM202ARS2]
MFKFALTFLIAASLFPSVAQSQPKTKADKAFGYLVTLCAGAHGRTDKLEIEGDGKGGLSLFARGVQGSGRVDIEERELEGFVDALRREQDALSADQRDKSRACMEERIDKILDAVLSEDAHRAPASGFVVRKDDIHPIIDGQVEVVVTKMYNSITGRGENISRVHISVRVPKLRNYSFRGMKKGNARNFEYREKEYRLQLTDVDLYEETAVVNITGPL